MNGPFDPNRHPRGWGGRWTNGAGRTPNAHAMAVPRRARPEAMKRQHAVVPHIRRPAARPAPGV